jgi:hypothetical protein
MDDIILKVKKERVLNAAKQCPTVDSAFRVLFPEVFEKPPIELKPGDIITIDDWDKPLVLVDKGFSNNGNWNDDTTVAFIGNPRAASRSYSSEYTLQNFHHIFRENNGKVIGNIFDFPMLQNIH